jgi:hypothetical protein
MKKPWQQWRWWEEVMGFFLLLGDRIAGRRKYMTGRRWR